MKFLLSFFFMLFIVIGLTMMAAHAVQNNGLPNLLAEWFPEHFGPEDGPRPEDTLMAPFIDPEDAYLAPDDNALAIPHTPETGINLEEELDLPHRSKDEIAEWLIKAVSETLNIEPETYATHRELLKTGLDMYALEDFDQFMQNSNILASLQSQNLKLHSYVEEKPVLLNAGPVEGRYRWLFEMPVTLSFLPAGTRDYRQLESTPLPNESIMVKVQVGRAGNVGPEGVMIESWEVRRNAPARARR